MPNIDLAKYADLQYFQYSVRRVVGAGLVDNGGFTKIQNDSDFLVQKIVANSTGAFTAQALDTGTGRQFYDRALNNVNLYGSAQRPSILLHPKLIYANSQINWVLTDLSGAPNTIEIVLEGIKCFKTLPANFVPRGVIQLEKYAEVDYFAYSLAPAAIAGFGTGIANIAIQGDSDFLLMKVTGNRTGAYRLQITDASCGWNFSDNFIDDANLIGTALQPNVLLHPQLILANSNLVVQLQDTSGAGNTVEAVFEGVKLFLGH